MLHSIRRREEVRARFPWIAGALALVALGCGAPETSATGAQGTFPEAPYATLMTESGTLALAVRTAPAQPPPRGEIAVEYTLATPAGAPRDGLDLTVAPWMPEMGHGASVEPVVEAVGEGRYRISNLLLYMPGRWELRTTIAGNEDDHVIVDLEVR
ncbi:MAG: FixH family protein [Minicystis sp.]